MAILKKRTTKQEDAPAKESTKKTVSTKKEAPVEATPVVATNVLVRPLVSEKSLMQEANGVYSFVVTPDASKVQVKQAIKQKYGVLPAVVRVQNYEGKRVRFGRLKGRRRDWKKAIVTLPKGQTISIHEGV